MRAVHYFIASLAVVAVLGFVFHKAAWFVSARADKMGRGKKKEEIEPWQK